MALTDDRRHATGPDGFNQRVAVEALVAAQGFGLFRGERQQGVALADVAFLAARQDEPQWQAQRVGDGVDFRAEATRKRPSASASALLPAAPAAQAWARLMVESMKTACKLGRWMQPWWSASQTPNRHQRENRLNTVFHLP